MSMKERPVVISTDGGKCFEHTYDSFELKAFIPDTLIDGEVHNYCFRSPLLLVFEENRQSMASAVSFAKETGLANIASKTDSSVLFIYPTCEGGWDNASESLYADIIKEVKMHQDYEDGIVSITDFFTREFKGYFIRGAIFRADIYSFGKSADYVAKNLLKKLDGEYLWGPGEITPAMCSMERLSVVPDVQRTDIGILSVGNSSNINDAFLECKNLLIKDKADYEADFKSFVRKFKMWVGNMEIEPDFEALDMTEEAGYTTVETSEFHLGKYKGTKTHKAGYFAYYNNGIFEKGPVPLVVGFHGGGDSSMFLTFVSGWWQLAHKYGFLYVGIENHQDVCADEAAQVIKDLLKKYNVDSNRVYATGFSMGSGKTWDMFQEYPELLAGIAPASALFAVKDNMFARPYGDWINKDISIPIFYSGGEKSHLPELPSQAESSLDRIKYASKVNRLKADFSSLDYSNKDAWTDPFYGIPGERVEKIEDPSRNSVLTINYYESEDGITRTAFASIDNQVHECRIHTNENAWLFISKFSKQ